MSINSSNDLRVSSVHPFENEATCYTCTNTIGGKNVRLQIYDGCDHVVVCPRILFPPTQGDLGTDSAALKAQDTKNEEAGEVEPTKNSM